MKRYLENDCSVPPVDTDVAAAQHLEDTFSFFSVQYLFLHLMLLGILNIFQLQNYQKVMQSCKDPHISYLVSMWLTLHQVFGICVQFQWLTIIAVIYKLIVS